MTIPERCLKCDWWNFSRARCDRRFSATIRVTKGGGDITITTNPGLIPDYLEEDLKVWLVTVMGDAIDAWPGWSEVNRIMEGGKPCPAEKPSAAIRQFGRHISLVKPLGEPQPEQNLDAHGLFKADISLL